MIKKPNMYIFYMKKPILYMLLLSILFIAKVHFKFYCIWCSIGFIGSNLQALTSETHVTKGELE